MILANMLNVDEEAVICDLAETYHIFNYRELPPLTVATLTVGLREDSRIKIKMSGSKTSFLNVLLASILDHLKLLVWLNSSDAQSGRNRPTSILETLVGEEKEPGNMSFMSTEDFDSYREKLIKEGENHGS